MSPIDMADKVRGTQTLDASDIRKRGYILSHLEEVLARYNFPPVEFPILEHLDVYMNNMREEFRDRLFILEDRTGRPLCLQPSVITSAAKMLMTRKGRQAMPLRLSYKAPVFRYETIRKGNLRQFTHVGAEHLLPRDGLSSVAEMMACAMDGAKAAGLQDAKLVISDVGILRAVVESLELPRAARSILLRHLMTPSEKLARYLPGTAQPEPDEKEGLTDALRGAIDKLSDEELVELTRVLLATEINAAYQGRQAGEVAHRLVRKLKRQSDQATYRKAIDALASIQKIKGKAGPSLERLKKASVAAGLETQEHLQKWKMLLKYLAAYGITDKNIQVDFGLIRSYATYDGITFELHHKAAGAVKSIAGGGQYDAGWAVGQQTSLSGCGFAFGLERIRMAAEKEGLLPDAALSAVDCLVITAGEVPFETAIGVAATLRESGLSVRLDLPSRGLKKELSTASTEKICFVVICGEQETKNNQVTVRDMNTRKEAVVKFKDLAPWIRKRLPEDAK